MVLKMVHMLILVSLGSNSLLDLCVLLPQHASPDVQLLLVGSKYDCESERKTSYDEAKQVSSTPVINLVTWLATYSLQRQMACSILRQVQKQVTMLMK